MSRATAAVFALVLLVGAAGVAQSMGVWYNSTASLPPGFYLHRGEGGVPERGDIVLACAPRVAAELAAARGYLPRGGVCPGKYPPLGKRVLAIEGDTVEHRRDGLSVNGRALTASKTATQDRQGRAMPHPHFGHRVLGPGEVWLYTPAANSYDSRYFGPIDTSALRGTVRALWTW